MTATIKLKFLEKGQEVDHEATFDGDSWKSEHAPTARLLNSYTSNWQLNGYYPDPVTGVALEVAESLKDTLKAEFVKADPIDYSEVPADALF